MSKKFDELIQMAHEELFFAEIMEEVPFSLGTPGTKEHTDACFWFTKTLKNCSDKSAEKAKELILAFCEANKKLRISAYEDGDRDVVDSVDFKALKEYLKD